jgi:signal transduction histidine kinase
VVQESLANAVRHQPGSSTTVRVATGHDVHVRVLSEGGKRRAKDGCIPGNGIQGMRERVEALHGSVSAGPAGRTAWLVECRLPEASS